MERASHPIVDHLKEVAWGVLMIDLVFGLMALLFLPHLGSGLTFAVFGTLAFMVTVLIVGLALTNVAWVLVRERRARRPDSGKH